MHLVIVESPTKAKTISRFLGKDYAIKYSMGHVMDLPKSKLGIDLAHDFAPQYEVMADKKKIIAELRLAAKNAETIYLATDPDREGEAIASNIKSILSTNPKSEIRNPKFKRIVFHEITENAIKHAVASPREVDLNLVYAQTARRILDRLVGYQLSPLLWKKVRRGLSAGRVQSVALRLIVEREREIEKFNQEPYFTVQAMLEKKGEETEFELIEIKGQKIEKSQTLKLYDGEYKSTKTLIQTREQAVEIIKDLQKTNLYVTNVSQRQIKRSPLPPFTTSTLQQDASRRFGYPGKRTMSLAQKLYEEGFITYHRTDSVILADTAVTRMRDFIKAEFGASFLPEKPRFYKIKQKSAQEAHEAIRPTQIDRIRNQESGIRNELGGDYWKLYDLIWRRALSSQMSDALIESTAVLVEAKNQNIEPDYLLKTNGSVLVFEGFLKINPQALQDKRLPQFMVGETLNARQINPEEHMTTPPPRYNEASLILTLEEQGIGRPSTYASIISTIVDRAYVERAEKRFVPTAVGIAVNDFLVTNFSDIDDIPFTAGMERELDMIAEGRKDWVGMLRDFYLPFEKKLSEVENAKRIKIAVEDTGEVCPECKEGNLVIRQGKFGKFISCMRFPDCKFTKPLIKETNFFCPKDQGKVIQRKTRTGRMFFGCANYPKCTFAVWKLEDLSKPQNPEKKAKIIKNSKKRNLVKKVIKKSKLRSKGDI